MSTHVLHIITGLEVGGAEMALYRLVLEFRGTQYSHTVIALTSGGMCARFTESGIKVIVLDLKHSPLSQCLRLYRLVQALQPDIVQTWLYHADFLGGLAARIAGNRNVIWGLRTTDVDGGCARTTSLVRKMCAALSRRVPHTIVCVAEAARRSHSLIGYDTARMVVVGNGFDLSVLTSTQCEREQLRALCGFQADDIVLGTLGRFDLDKDHANFVQAAARLAQGHERLRFLMVGKDLDGNNTVLMRWIEETGHAERFVLLGERSDVATCLNAMDIFCLSSRTEAFPNVVGEAMAIGLPCVATDVGDVGVLMADTGVVVPKADPDALAQGVGQLLALDPTQRKHIGERARERIRATYTMACMRQRFEGIYENVMARGERGCAD